MSYRSGFIGVIGYPNAGKSTLMNAWVKEKVSIVTSKPQTTRRRVVGILTREDGQIIFVDSPGLIDEKKGLNAFLATEAREVIADVDSLVVVISTDTKTEKEVDDLLKVAADSGKAIIGVISKTDLVQFERRVPLIEEKLKALKNLKSLFRVSVHGDKLNEEFDLEMFFKECLKILPESPQPLYDSELYTTHDLRELAAEMVREACFLNLHQELPYSLAVKIQKFDESDPGMTRIHADIIVAKASHKAIVVGKGGSVIKEIGTAARKSIQSLVGTKVYLALEVVVKEDWYENQKMMKELGYASDDK